MRGASKRATEIGQLALRPPGLVSLSVLFLDIITFVVLFGFRMALLLMLVALIATVVATYCIVRGRRE